MEAKEFILNRAQELIDVPIQGPDGEINIQIRARLTKKEIKEHKVFMEMFQNPDEIEEDEADKVAASFLATITTDSELDIDFWSSEDIDSSIAQEIIIAFLEKAASTLKGVQKFRK